jgi:nucleolar protein 56
VKVSDLVTAQRGLAHSYSRAKVKFNVNKADNMIIQSISLLDQLDKDINTFAMRVREWYSWHFPELVKIVNDNILFARVVHLLKGRENASEELLDSLEAIIGDQDKSKQVLQAAKVSMGTDISEVDMLSIIHFAERVIKLAEYRQGLQSYLHKRMNDIAPNLSALIGETVGARLIKCVCLAFSRFLSDFPSPAENVRHKDFF